MLTSYLAAEVVETRVFLFLSAGTGLTELIWSELSFLNLSLSIEDA